MLASKDYAAASKFLRELYAQRDPERFPAFVARGLHPLVGGDQVTWNEMALSVSWARVVAYPPQRDAEWVTRTFAAHMHEHPGIRAWRREGSAGVRAISDFLSPREYHATGIYQRLYRHLGYEDQLAPSLTPPGGHALALAFGRGRYGISERDRAMVAYLAPHVLQAWRNVQALARAERAAARHREVLAALGQCVIELDARGRPLDCPERAERWLRQYFSDAPLRGTGHLPATVDSWVRRCGAGDVEGGQPRPLVRRRGGRWLVIRCFPLTGGGALLTLEERTDRRAAVGMREHGLTRREIEVLLELESGRTNAEAAAELSISPATVKKHLDNIYAKLGVSNRTAAVARLRGAADES